ncbi:hypothetical protein O3M35_007015 [Rhynocoris fuscipes]|uniref:Mitochondrial 28S ribosomal protein S27 n=1 Tax=Rhynocoris fuscipes TaxID=488301 RepID=A0AAW1DH85_9HEMI
MLRIIRLGSFLKCKHLESYSALRPFMSESFQCKDAWNRRFNDRILKKVKLNELFYDLDNKFNQVGKVSAVDVDIFTNAINDDSHLEELDEIIHRFRLTSEAGKILDSTHHGFIRAFLSHGDSDELLRILNDRLNYGIFPDDYCTILLMDHFIKENNFTKAAKIATLQMLQEDFNNPIIKFLSLYSCHKYLLEPGTWEKEEQAKEDTKNNEDDEEEIRVRVGFIRNPYFDDHFDLTEPYSLIGKTFKIISENENDQLFNSYHLLGLILYKKWPEALNFTNKLISKNEQIYVDSIKEIEKFLSKLPKVEGEEGNKVQEYVEQIKSDLAKFKSNNLIVEKNLLAVTEGKVNESVKKLEQILIDKQCTNYEEWEKKREEVLLAELEEIKRLERIENVKTTKEELAKKEQELFFFDIEDQLDLKIENKRVRYPPKWLGKKKKKRPDTAEYVPPEVNTRRMQ